MKTESEKLFEHFCVTKSISCEKIEEESSKRPDYLISISGLKVVAEVKQLNPNKEDKAKYKEFKEKGFAVGDSPPGARVRGKITDSAPQISSLAKGKFPGLLVLYNTVPLANLLDPYHIKVAMYGLDTVVISRPALFEERPHVIERKSGPKRKLTENHNTSISAIAVLKNSQNGLSLDVYHNQHAAIPFADGVFGELGCEQYRIKDHGHYEFISWSSTKS